jgi:hypothetical protein
VCVCGILPLLDADGTQHSSIIPDVTSRVCFFFHLSSTLHPFLLTFVLLLFRVGWLPPGVQLYTHWALYSSSSSSVCVSPSSSSFFLSLSSISSFAHSFLLCLSVTCGVIYNSCVRPCLLHTHMEDDSFGPTLLSLFWFSK